MTREQPRNLIASVRQRLLNLAQAQGEDFGLILTQYALERLLYRLSRSPHRDLLVLKGAMLFRLWSGQRHRPTRDLDLLGKGDSSAARFEQIFREVCQQAVEEDGLEFRADSIASEAIRPDEEYQGVRINLEAGLGNARISLQVDIGFGDVITPGTVQVAYPTLLAFPAANLWAYPRETVVAEKFQAMVWLGRSNSRMKDFFDIWFLARHFAFEGGALAGALLATFQRRQTALPVQAPLALTAAFAGDSTKQTQWQAFLRKNKLEPGGAQLDQVVGVLREFLMPPSKAMIAGRPFRCAWPAAGPWQAC
jgi:predicted nucleotidyltransferase component of viral defense system